MADVFGRSTVQVVTPLTADNVQINWGGIFTDAASIQIGAAQPITRRRTIGNSKALIYQGQPSGNISITELTSEDANAIFGLPGWNACTPATITFTAGSCSAGIGLNLTALGCVVTQYSVAAEAEGLTVIAQVGLEFLQLLNQ